MSLILGANTSDRDSCGSAAGLDGLTAFTVMLWVYITTRTDLRILVSKINGGTLGWVWRLQSTSGNSQFLWIRATQNLSYINTGTPFALNTWVCAAATLDQGGTASALVKMYFGGLTTTLAAASGYSVTQDGSGAYTSADAQNLVCGNSDGAVAALQGSEAVAMHWNRVLSLGELKQQQFRPHKTSGCILLSHLGYGGTGTQPDYSGSGNNGTVTGATVGAHVPLAAAFG